MGCLGQNGYYQGTEGILTPLDVVDDDRVAWHNHAVGEAGIGQLEVERILLYCEQGADHRVALQLHVGHLAACLLQLLPAANKDRHTEAEQGKCKYQFLHCSSFYLIVLSFQRERGSHPLWALPLWVMY